MKYFKYTLLKVINHITSNLELHEKNWPDSNSEAWIYVYA